MTVLENEPAPVSVRLEPRARRARPDPARGMSGCIARTIRRCGLRGRRWATSGDHRGSIRASFGTGTGEGDPICHGTRGTPHGSPSARTSASSSTQEQAYRNDQRDTFTARRLVSPSLRDASGWRCVKHPARQTVTPDSQTSDPGRSRAPEETPVARWKCSCRKGSGTGISRSGKMSRSR